MACRSRRPSPASCSSTVAVKILETLPIRNRPDRSTRAPVAMSPSPAVPDHWPARPVIRTSAPVMSSLGSPESTWRKAAGSSSGSAWDAVAAAGRAARAADAGTIAPAVTAAAIVTTARAVQRGARVRVFMGKGLLSDGPRAGASGPRAILSASRRVVIGDDP
ncbi:protein of unknown function [Streptantibioticus cattleyicolor NRRL 8057 = DSM 46488]|nr:protein of unknown function [Streptantibioticus cattleyicolor NRRL 8057 = DSM 46488]